MSIYDGQCDFGCSTATRCPLPATRHSDNRTFAYCNDHGSDYGHLLSGTWPQAVERYEAGQREVVKTIEQAERAGLFLWCFNEALSPREVRQRIKNGWTVTSLSTVDPLKIAEGYEREADEAAAEARRKRSEARRILGEMERQKSQSGAGSGNNDASNIAPSST